MPDIRCRFFDSNGAPVPYNGRQRCPAGSKCRFIHPDNPAWNSTGDNRGPSGAFRRDANPTRRFSDHNSRIQDSGYKGRQPRQESAWNYDQSHSDSSSTNAYASSSKLESDRPSTSGGKSKETFWDSASNKRSSFSAGTGGWPSTTIVGSPKDNKDASDFGWGGGGGWGSSNDTASGAQWNSGDGGWGGDSGWGNASWGGTEKADDKPADPKKESNVERRISQPRDRNNTAWPTPVAPSTTASTVIPNPEPNSRSSHARTPSGESRTPAEVAQPPSPSPLPTREPAKRHTKATPTLAGGPPPMRSSKGALQKEAIELLSRGKERMARVGSIEPHTPLTPTTSDRGFKGPQGRLDLYRKVIRTMQHLVFLNLELQQTQSEKERIARGQASPLYEHSGPGTQQLLNDTRRLVSTRYNETKIRLDRNMNLILSLPDMAAADQPLLPPALVKEKIAEYTTELKNWFADLHLEERISNRMEEDEASLSPTPLASNVAPSTQPESQPPAPSESETGSTIKPTKITAAELLEDGNYTWADIQHAVTHLEKRLMSIAERVYAALYTQPDMSDLISSIPDQFSQICPDPWDLMAERGVQDELDIPPLQTEELSRGVGRVGDDMLNQAISIQDLMPRLQQLEDDVQLVKSENEKLDALCLEAERQLSKLAELNRQDEVKIKELTEEIRNLHAFNEQRHTSATSASVPSITQPTPSLDANKMDELFRLLQPLLLAQLEKEVQPLIDALGKRCAESQEVVRGAISDMLVRPLQLTDEICHRAMEINGAASQEVVRLA